MKGTITTTTYCWNYAGINSHSQVIKQKELAAGALNKVITTCDCCPEHQERLKKYSEKTR